MSPWFWTVPDSFTTISYIQNGIIFLSTLLLHYADVNTFISTHWNQQEYRIALPIVFQRTWSESQKQEMKSFAWVFVGIHIHFRQEVYLQMHIRNSKDKIAGLSKFFKMTYPLILTGNMYLLQGCPNSGPGAECGPQQASMRPLARPFQPGPVLSNIFTEL